MGSSPSKLLLVERVAIGERLSVLLSESRIRLVAHDQLDRRHAIDARVAEHRRLDQHHAEVRCHVVENAVEAADALLVVFLALAIPKQVAASRREGALLISFRRNHDLRLRIRHHLEDVIELASGAVELHELNARTISNKAVKVLRSQLSVTLNLTVLT